MSIGFKASWHKRTRTKKQKEEQLPTIIPGSAIAHILEIQMKIQEHEDYMLTSAYSRLNKSNKAEILSAYRFLTTTLATINLPQNQLSNPGLNMFAYNDGDIDGSMED